MKRREFLIGGVALGGLAACQTETASKPAVAAPPAAPKADTWSGAWQVDATAQGELLRKGEVSSKELVNLAISRTGKLNPDLHFMTEPSFAQARAHSGMAHGDGPFAGIPTFTKDLVATKGVKTRYGSAAFKDYAPKMNDGFADVMEAAGMISIGKSATPEFGFLPVTEPLAYGPTRNPWNPDHTPGGSSGGSASAVASGAVSMASASDGGGSIRIPSNCCGLFGMKASRGRWQGYHYDKWSLSVPGFVSRSVRDIKTAMSGMSNAMPGVPAPVLAGSGMEKKYKIGFRVTTPDGEKVHPDCERAVLNAAKLCADMGHKVEETHIDYSWRAFWDAFLTDWAFLAKGAVDKVAKQMGQMPPRQAFEPFTWYLYDMVKDKGAPAVAAAYAQFAKEKAAQDKFHETCDFQLSPVLGEPAVKIGHIDQGGDLDAMRPWLEHYVGFTPWANATGCPAMSVPMLRTAENVPVGVQFEGAFGDEANLFALAEQIEAAQPWAGAWPAIAGF